MFNATTRIQKTIATMAITLSFLAYIPQVAQIVERKSADDISYLFVAFVMLAGILWMIYAISRLDLVMAVAYFAGFLMTSSILVLKIYYERRKRNTI